MKITLSYRDLKDLIQKAVDTRITNIDWLLSEANLGIEIVGFKETQNKKFVTPVVEKDIESSLLKTNEDSKKIDDLDISVRAYNCIIRHIQDVVNSSKNNSVKNKFRNFYKPSMEDFYVCTPKLKFVRNCGARVANEIISAFKENGFDVSNWENEFKKFERPKKSEVMKKENT